MKIKIFKLDATVEINEICCDLFDADLQVCASDDKQLKVEYPNCKTVSVAVGDNRLIINQAKPLLPLFKRRIVVYVPTHVLPNLQITGKRSAITLEDGLFGDLTINADYGKLELINCSFASVSAVCGNAYVHFNESTVKGNLTLQIENGELLAENSFALYADCQLKNGNMGLINLSGKEFAFETANGNVTLTLAGTEDEYNTVIRVKNGTSNKESKQNEGAVKSVKALTDNGNVMLDFVGERVEIAEAATAADNAQEGGEEKENDGEKIYE